jgi:hypothetical protein
MSDRNADFVPIARLLSPTEAAQETTPAPQVDEIDTARPAHERDDPSRAALRDVRIFRAALADALESELSDLSRDVAIAILARELELAPVDVRAIARRALERAASHEVLSIRVHPSELNVLEDCELPASGDPALRRGDVAIDVRSGTIDATLGARLSEWLGAREMP